MDDSDFVRSSKSTTDSGQVDAQSVQMRPAGSQRGEDKVAFLSAEGDILLNSLAQVLRAMLQALGLEAEDFLGRAQARVPSSSSEESQMSRLVKELQGLVTETLGTPEDPAQRTILEQLESLAEALSSTDFFRFTEDAEEKRASRLNQRGERPPQPAGGPGGQGEHPLLPLVRAVEEERQGDLAKLGETTAINEKAVLLRLYLNDMPREALPETLALFAAGLRAAYPLPAMSAEDRLEAVRAIAGVTVRTKLVERGSVVPFARRLWGFATQQAGPAGPLALAHSAAADPAYFAGLLEAYAGAAATLDAVSNTKPTLEVHWVRAVQHHEILVLASHAMNSGEIPEAIQQRIRSAVEVSLNNIAVAFANIYRAAAQPAGATSPERKGFQEALSILQESSFRLEDRPTENVLEGVQGDLALRAAESEGLAALLIRLDRAVQYDDRNLGPMMRSYLSALAGLAQETSGQWDRAAAELYNAAVRILLHERDTREAQGEIPEERQRDYTLGRSVLNAIGLYYSTRYSNDPVQSWTAGNGQDCAVNLFGALSDLKGIAETPLGRGALAVAQLVLPLLPQMDRLNRARIDRSLETLYKGAVPPSASEAVDQSALGRAALELAEAIVRERPYPAADGEPRHAIQIAAVYRQLLEEFEGQSLDEVDQGFLSDLGQQLTKDHTLKGVLEGAYGRFLEDPAPVVFQEATREVWQQHYEAREEPCPDLFTAALGLGDLLVSSTPREKPVVPAASEPGLSSAAFRPAQPVDLEPEPQPEQRQMSLRDIPDEYLAALFQDPDRSEQERMAIYMEAKRRGLVSPPEDADGPSPN